MTSLEIIQLSDPDSGASAKIVPGLGFNCFSFRPRPGGEPLEVLWSAPDFANGRSRPVGSGLPILFPFPGRIRGTSFRYGGHEYLLDAGDGRGNAIHGFVHDRKWRVVEQSDTRAVGAFQASVDQPALLSRWPADFSISVAYELRAGALDCDIEIFNPDSRGLPFGLGVHGYFRVPLARGGNFGDCQITVPASECHELADLMPTGRLLATDLPVRLFTGMLLGDAQLDNVLGGLACAGESCTTRIHDPRAGRTVTQSFDREFRYCTVYTPPHREAICIEPYTALPNAIELTERGVDAGLRILSPGESFHVGLQISVVRA